MSPDPLEKWEGGKAYRANAGGWGWGTPGKWDWEKQGHEATKEEGKDKAGVIK